MEPSSTADAESSNKHDSMKELPPFLWLFAYPVEFVLDTPYKFMHPVLDSLDDQRPACVALALLHVMTLLLNTCLPNLTSTEHTNRLEWTMRTMESTLNNGIPIPTARLNSQSFRLCVGNEMAQQLTSHSTHINAMYAYLATTSRETHDAILWSLWQISLDYARYYGQQGDEYSHFRHQSLYASRFPKICDYPFFNGRGTANTMPVSSVGWTKIGFRIQILNF